MKSKDYGRNALPPSAAAGAPPPIEVSARLAPKNPELEKYDQYGNTRALEAAYNGNIKKIQSLASEGADINAQTKDEYRDTLLHKAVTGKKPIETVRCLLDLKADVHALNATCQTAGHYAAYHGNAPVLKMLLEAKADVNAREKNHGDDLAHKVVASEIIHLAHKPSLLELLKSYGAANYS